MKRPYELFHIECGEGWYGLIEPLIKECIEKGYVIGQIKEKYGGLRFYVDNCPDEFRDRLDEAEAQSYHICDECGEPGVLRGGGWLRTLCDTHAEGRLPYQNPSL